MPKNQKEISSKEDKAVNDFIKKNFPKANAHFLMVFMDDNKNGTKAFQHAAVGVKHLMVLHNTVDSNIHSATRSTAERLMAQVFGSSKVAKKKGKKK